MQEEFKGRVPNARIMIEDVPMPETLSMKEEIQAIAGVTDVLWLDNTINITEPLEIQDQASVETIIKIRMPCIR